MGEFEENPDEEDLFLDMTENIDISAAMGSNRGDGGEHLTRKRMRAKGPPRGTKRKELGASYGGDGGEAELEYLPTSDDETKEALVAERVPRSDQKQQDKEVKWQDIPEMEKPLYVQAEIKQMEGARRLPGGRDPDVGAVRGGEGYSASRQDLEFSLCVSGQERGEAARRSYGAGEGQGAIVHCGTSRSRSPHGGALDGSSHGDEDGLLLPVGPLFGVSLDGDCG